TLCWLGRSLTLFQSKRPDKNWPPTESGSRYCPAARHVSHFAQPFALAFLVMVCQSHEGYSQADHKSRAQDNQQESQRRGANLDLRPRAHLVHSMKSNAEPDCREPQADHG